MLRKIQVPHLFGYFLALQKSFPLGCNSWSISLFHKTLLFLYLDFFHYVEIWFLENHNFTDSCDHTLSSFIFMRYQALNGQYCIAIFISPMLKSINLIYCITLNTNLCVTGEKIEELHEDTRDWIIIYILWLNKKCLASFNSNIQYTCLWEHKFFSYF